eukprot:7385343-Prymnesium_polylepis.4
MAKLDRLLQLLPGLMDELLEVRRKRCERRLSLAQFVEGLEGHQSACAHPLHEAWSAISFVSRRQCNCWQPPSSARWASEPMGLSMTSQRRRRERSRHHERLKRD